MIKEVGDWLVQNFYDQEIVIFDVGAADLQDSIEYKKLLPKAKVYAFECNDDWLQNNIPKALEHGIIYNHCAVSDVTGHLEFYPSKTLYGKYWPLSGSLCKPHEGSRFEWKETVKVPTITLNDYCRNYNVHPTFIHMDIQGAEVRAMSQVGNYKPKAIVAEICEFQTDYDTGTNYYEWLNLMNSLGYNEHIRFNWDGLYVLRD